MIGCLPRPTSIDERIYLQYTTKRQTTPTKTTSSGASCNFARMTFLSIFPVLVCGISFQTLANMERAGRYVTTLPKTKSSRLKIGPNPKRKVASQAPFVQGRTVSFRESHIQHEKTRECPQEEGLR